VREDGRGRANGGGQSVRRGGTHACPPSALPLATWAAEYGAPTDQTGPMYLTITCIDIMCTARPERYEHQYRVRCHTQVAMRADARLIGGHRAIGRRCTHATLPFLHTAKPSLSRHVLNQFHNRVFGQKMHSEGDVGSAAHPLVSVEKRRRVHLDGDDRLRATAVGGGVRSVEGRVEWWWWWCVRGGDAQETTNVVWTSQVQHSVLLVIKHARSVVVEYSTKRRVTDGAVRLMYDWCVWVWWWVRWTTLRLREN
jgi:hypothetical protein